tara:strand:- start:50 stop:1207 length:1158 start_codon:yes stop_codon:yes gene_type:complete
VLKPKTLNFEDLIIKYLNQNTSVEDLKNLLVKLKEKENVKLFKSYIKTNYYSLYVLNDIDRKDIIKVIKNKIDLERKNSKRIDFVKKSFQYAALFILVLGLGYYIKSTQQNIVVEEKIVPKADDIVLETENGEQLILEKEEKSVKIDSKINLLQKSNKLVYDNDLEIETLIFHSLKVPYGKRFDIVLSDNSKVYLNSGSILRYPVKFLNNQIREVFLEGEAFFDISEDEKNIFRVNSNGINVEVYGTKFNFKNYPEDYVSDIVLVNGSVGISNSENKSITKLSPGFKGSVDKENYKVEKVKINTKIYTSWIEGQVVFRGESFNQIIKKLERLYNVTIINNNVKISEELFNASIDTENEKIEDVLNYFNKIYNIEYQIYNNKIIIN